MMAQLQDIPEQTELLDMYGKSVVVSASAGSGKTSVLTRKIAKILEEGKSSIERILVLTYTKAAAFEMKQRLNSLLIEKSLNNKKIIKDLDGISIADISTFHSFYERMIKKYFYELGISPSFIILSQEETDLIKSKAMKKAIQKFKKECLEGYNNLLSKLCTKRTDDKLYEIVFLLYEFLSTQDDKESWKKNIAKITYKEQDNIAIKIVKDNFENQLKRIKTNFVNLQKEAEQQDETYAVTLINSIMPVIEEYNEKFDFENIYSKICAGTKLQMLQKNKINNTDLCAKLDKNKSKLADLLKIDKFGDFGSYDFIKESFCQNAKIIDDLLLLEEIFESEFSKLKEKEDAFDFVDLEQKMMALLQNEEIKQSIQNSYDFVFVDEYQDANLIQDKIVSQIAKENNKFLVGDPKQGIYAFRQSDSQIITDKIQEFKNSEYAEAKALNSNFRTDKRILDFDNIVFSALMNKKTSDIDYQKDAQLVGKAKYKNSDVCPVNILVIKQDEKEEKQEKIAEVYSVLSAEQKEENSNSKKEALLIVDKISDLVHKQIYIEKEDIFRDVNFSDIAILVRKRGDFTKQLCEVFDDHKIPYSFSVKKNILEYPEIALLFNYLKLLANDYDDIALLSVLSSNFGNLTFNELAKIKLKYTQEKSFYDCVKKYASEMCDDISEKIKSFYDVLEEERFDFAEKGVYVELNLLCEKYNILNYKLLEEDGFSKVERIKKFIYLFKGNKFNKDISGFIQFVTNSGGELNLNDSGQQESNCVLIDTMHSSKGLEYPIVFLSDLGGLLDSVKDSTGTIKTNKDLGIVLKNYNAENKLIYQSVSQKCVEIVKKQKEFEEKLRLLYVGMTRAKNALFMTGILKNNVEKIETDEDVNFVYPRTYINLICSSLEQSTIDKINENQSINTKDFIVEVFKQNEIEYNKVIPVQNSIELDDNFEEKLKEQITFEYKNQASVFVAEKTSITKLTQSENDYENLVESPKKLETKDIQNGVSAKVKGIVLHYILEQIDFDISKEDLFNFICEYVKNNKDIVDEFFTQEYIFKTILKALQLLKNVLPSGNQNLKEKEFMLKISPKEFGVSDIEDCVLVQGKIDLLSLGEKNIIVDYKYSGNGTEEDILKKYSGQINAYKLAVQKGIGKKVDEMYFLLLKNSKLVKV